jgi:hypothetical protein
MLVVGARARLHDLHAQNFHLTARIMLGDGRDRRSLLAGARYFVLRPLEQATIRAAGGSSSGDKRGWTIDGHGTSSKMVKA